LLKDKGKVWLVGAGPSDAGLITVKGLKVLNMADVVVFDRLVGVEILNMIPKTAKKIDVGKNSGNHSVPQEEINRILLREGLAGNIVVRLKGGDPFLFGRGGEEIVLLAENDIPYEIIPGITSAISVPAYAGIPVTHRDCCSSLHIITGHTKKAGAPDIDFEALVKLKGTLVFLMGISSLTSICSGLMRAGMPSDMPVAVIEKGTTARQRKLVSCIGNLAEEAEKNNIQAPAIIIVGTVCSLSKEFEWAEKRPLHGKRVIVTRPEMLCSTLSEKIRSLGGEAIEFPCIRTFPLKINPALDGAIAHLRDYNWLVFTSVAGVEFFLEKLKEEGKDIRELFGLKLAAIGSGTEKAFLQRGVRVDLVPSVYNARTLGEELAERVGQGEKVLLLRAEEGSPELTEVLSSSGVNYSEVPVYKTVFNSDNSEFSREIIEKGLFDFAAFTSGSTVKGFVRALPDLDFSNITAVCIGEQTAMEAKKQGMKVVVSQKATIDSLVEAIKGYSFQSVNI